MKTYFNKKLSDFKISDLVIINNDTSYVSDIRYDGDTITLILTGAYNHTGHKNSTVTTYGEKKRTRKTKEEINYLKHEIQEQQNEDEKYEQLYQEFLDQNNIINNISHFELTTAGEINVGDIIKRSKHSKIEKVLEIEDLGDSVFIKGWKGFYFEDLGKRLYTERKSEKVFRYLSKKKNLNTLPL